MKWTCNLKVGPSGPHIYKTLCRRRIYQEGIFALIKSGHKPKNFETTGQRITSSCSNKHIVPISLLFLLLCAKQEICLPTHPLSYETETIPSRTEALCDLVFLCIHPYNTGKGRRA